MIPNVDIFHASTNSVATKRVNRKYWQLEMQVGQCSTMAIIQSIFYPFLHQYYDY